MYSKLMQLLKSLYLKLFITLGLMMYLNKKHFKRMRKEFNNASGSLKKTERKTTKIPSKAVTAVIDIQTH